MEIDIDGELQKQLGIAKAIDEEVQLIQARKQELIQELFKVQGAINLLNGYLGTPADFPGDITEEE